MSAITIREVDPLPLRTDPERAMRSGRGAAFPPGPGDWAGLRS